MTDENANKNLAVIIVPQRWQVDQGRRQKALDRQVAIACGEDDDASPRDVTAAFKAILAAEAQNQNDEQHTDNRLDQGRNRILELLERGATGEARLKAKSGRKRITDGGDQQASTRKPVGKNKGGKPRRKKGSVGRHQQAASGRRVNGRDPKPDETRENEAGETGR